MAPTATPPVFSDIAKAANDCLGKDLPTGSAKLEVNSTTSNGVKFTLVGTKDNKTNAIFNELKAKYSHKPAGLTVTQTLNTASVASLTVEVADQLAKGLKLDFNTHLITPKCTKYAKLGAEYKCAGIAARAAVDVFKGPLLSADAVLAKHGVMAGAELGYDVAEAKLNKINYALAYAASDFSVALLAFGHCSTFNAVYHHRVSERLEGAAKAAWTRAEAGAVAVEFASKYVLDKDAFVKAKVDSAGRVGLGYTQILRPGVKLALGAVMDACKMEEAAPAHKVGFQLTVDA